jgi:hypothetical protein
MWLRIHVHTAPEVYQQLSSGGSGVIGAKWRPPTAVIPAKAGIQSANARKQVAYGLDSRFGGNECACPGPPTSGNAATRAGLLSYIGVASFPLKVSQIVDFWTVFRFDGGLWH